MSNLLVERTKQSRGKKSQSELAVVLQSIGVPHGSAAVLTALKSADWIDSTTLQRSSGLRQPEVSVAVRQLVEDEMVEIEPQRNGQRGRPRHMYRLTGELSEIIQPYVDEAESRLKHLEENLARLDEVSSALSPHMSK